MMPRKEKKKKKQQENNNNRRSNVNTLVQATVDQSSFARVPNELLLYTMMSFFEFKELAPLIKTNKRFYNIFKNHIAPTKQYQQFKQITLAQRSINNYLKYLE